MQIKNKKDLFNALLQIDEAYQEGAIDDYAIGGPVAAAFYASPRYALGIDLYIPIKKSIDDIYDKEYFKEKGYYNIAGGNHLLTIEGWPILVHHLWDGDGALEIEAVEQAVVKPLNNRVSINIMSPEHLAAISLRSNIFTDYVRVDDLVNKSDTFDHDKFYDILGRYNLIGKWQKKHGL